MRKFIYTIALVLSLTSIKAQDIFSAARSNDTVQMAEYIKQGIDINQANAKGFTPLILAVYNNNAEAVKFLISKGAKVDAQDMSGNTALMGATFKGYVNMVDILLSEGKANVNQINANGASALIFAATFGQKEIVEKLIAEGADVTIKDSRGKTAKDHAVMQENESIVNIL